MEKKFRKGEIVWAKVRGFPWWPAIVKGVNVTIRREESENCESESKEISIVAYFIGDDTHSELPVNKIEKFSENLEEFSKTKKRSLLTSIAIAKKILSGEIPFEKHLQYARRKNLKLYEDKSEQISEELEIKRPKFMLGKKRKIERSYSNKSDNQDFPLNLDNTSDPSEKLNKLDGIEISSSPRMNTSSPTQIDVKVKEDLSKNIKINININVNNNTSNTVNITTIANKINQSESNLSEESLSDNENHLESIESLKENIDSLLFYKIDMPATSRDRSILTNLDLIQTKLSKIKNCHIYNVI
jgi:hypothetical protein